MKIKMANYKYSYLWCVRSANPKIYKWNSFTACKPYNSL